MKTYTEKLGQHGEIRIPEHYLKEMGLYPGGEVEFRLMGRKLLLEPVKETQTDKKPLEDPLEALTGSIPLDDPKLIDEIVESEEIYG